MILKTNAVIKKWLPYKFKLESNLNFKTVSLKLKNNKLYHQTVLHIINKSNNLFLNYSKSIFALKQKKLNKKYYSNYFTSAGSFGYKNAIKKKSTTLDKIFDKFIPKIIGINTKKNLPFRAGHYKKKLLNVHISPYKRTRWLFWLLRAKLRIARIKLHSLTLYDNIPFGGTRVKKKKRK